MSNGRFGVGMLGAFPRVLIPLRQSAFVDDCKPEDLKY
jgi:hypothetical protein